MGVSPVLQHIMILVCLCTVADLLTAKPYRGAELRTKEAYTYGRFAIRYQSAPGAGQTSTFFTYHDGGIEWNEIDIEILGRYTDGVQFNTITPGQTNHVSHSFVEFNPHIGFHTYAFEWTPEYVAWFIDGEEVHRQTGEHISTLVHPQKIMMNIWPPVYSDWVGELDPRILPLFAYYDWVEYASYTPGDGDTGTERNFTLQWHDDFDTWDRDRWSKATHTWGGNNSEFSPDNIAFRDGLMILCLTNEGETGYRDTNRPTILWARSGGDDEHVTAKFSEPVEKSSAETRANYSIAGATVTGVVLQPDNQTVVLATEGMDPETNYNLVCFNVKDTPPGNNTLLGANVEIRRMWSPEFPIRINVGGDTLGNFLGDQLWGPDVEYGYEDGDSHLLGSGIDIAGTIADSIYLTDRRGIVAYRVRLPGGTYPIRLMFSENQFHDAGQRSFDIFVEGNRVADDLDLAENVGRLSAYDISPGEVSVTDGVLDIFFADTPFGGAVLNGIVIDNPVTGIGCESGRIPPAFRLSPVYPNPFNAMTTIRYSLDSPATVRGDIVNLQGQVVDTVPEHPADAGDHLIRWNAGNQGSGIYFLQMQARIDQQIHSDTHKLILLR